MTWSLGESIFRFDIQFFNWIHRNYVGAWTEQFFVFMGNPFFWMPLWTFLGILLAFAKPKRALWHIFFGFGAYVISYQAAYVISMMVGRMPPYQVIYEARGWQMAAYSFPYFPSMPDWASASIAALICYAIGMGRHLGIYIPKLIWVILPVFTIARVVPGYAYPLDTIAGYILGWLLGFLFVKIAKNLPYVMNWED